MPVAIVTGGSKGLGRSLAGELLDRGWHVVIDGRTRATLAETAERLGARAPGSLSALVGTVADPEHRSQLIHSARSAGGLDLLVNNASVLGPSPLPTLRCYPLTAYQEVFDVNVLAPLALVQSALEHLEQSPFPRVVNITSDAAVEPYQGWGGYGSSKAALEHWGAIMAAEEPTVRVWTVDPGDMRTDMHQAAFPGEDISDLPSPDEAARSIVALIESDLGSGRYRASDIAGLLSIGGAR